MAGRTEPEPQQVSPGLPSMARTWSAEGSSLSLRASANSGAELEMCAAIEVHDIGAVSEEERDRVLNA